MDPREHARLAEHEAHHWWHVGRRHLIRSVLRGVLPPGPIQILDVGCGTGGNFALLGELGSVQGIEPPGAGLESCRARGFDVIEGDAAALPVPDDALDLVTALDVLEHLDDDRAAVVEMRRVLRPGGLLLVSVPAYPSLWSPHDEALGHRRRYTAPGLHGLLEGAGFRVLRRTHGFAAPLPAVALVRMAQARWPALAPDGASYVPLPRPLNRLLSEVVRLEAAVLRHVGLPAGTSIFAVARA